MQLSAFLAQHGAQIGLVVLAAMFVAFLLERVPPAVVAAAGAALFIVLGFVDEKTALAAFSNSAPITIAALFVISGALVRTGLLAFAAGLLVKLAERSRIAALGGLFTGEYAASAFLNNTPVVVVLIPVAVRLSRTIGVAATRLLIPVSYIAVLGGTVTLIGTSTNLLVAGVAQQNGMAPIGLFEMTPVALLAGAAGLATLLLLGPWLLPAREDMAALVGDESSLCITELAVGAASDFVGRAPAEIGALNHEGMQILSVQRGTETLKAGLNEIVLAAGDRLTIRAPLDEVLTLHKRKDDQLGQRTGIDRPGPRRIVEAMVSANSPLAGEQLRRTGMPARYGAVPIAVHRPRHLAGPTLSAMRLRAGDMLLLETNDEGLAALNKDAGLVYISEPDKRAFERRGAPIALAVLAGVIGLSAIGFMPITLLAIVGAVLVVLLGCIQVDEALASIDGQLLVLIFSMLIVGAALDNAGSVRWVVGSLAPLAAGAGPLVALAFVYALTSLLTETVSNNAVAVIVTPLAIGLAQSTGADPVAFVLAVMMGASASFATPIGYQTNTLVYGAGAYRFSDFLKIGVPMNIVVGVATVAAIWFFYLA